jgi:hypothetical protein
METTALGTTFSFTLGESELASNALSFFSSNNLGVDASFEERLSERLVADGSIIPSDSSASKQVIHLSPAAAPIKTEDMTQQQKIAAALLRAGVSSPAAWAAAGVTTSPVANSDPNGLPPSVPNGRAQAPPQLAPDGFDPHPPVVLMKGKNNPTFLISWRSQRDLTRSLGWKCALMIWGGPLLSLLCLYGLHTLTHWF